MAFYAPADSKNEPNIMGGVGLVYFVVVQNIEMNDDLNYSATNSAIN